MGENDPGILINHFQTNKMKSKELRQKEALERQKDYNSLTVAQKVLKLDIKLGGGKGAVKERAKLAFQAAQSVKTSEPEVVGESKKRKPYQKPKRS